MSESELTANDLISLGFNLHSVGQPEQYDLFNYFVHLQSLINRLRTANFVNTRHVAEPLFDRISQLTHDFDAGKTKYKNSIEQIRAVAQSISDILLGEGNTKTLILTEIKPPDAIYHLANLQSHQEALRQDVVMCLKAHLARPAIILAWALGYDLVRTWIFNDGPRLQAFNTQLATSARKGEPSAVTAYTDLFRLGEYRVLSICRDAQDAPLQRFTDRELRELQGMLDDRNRFAHASHSQASPAEADVFVERIVRIVTSPPFI
jgi:hypothetical protein